jgi:DNA repair photolyase
MLLLKNSITMRGDSLSCPLSLSLDSYGNCLTDCHHCFLRNLNHVWGKELKPADLEILEKKLKNGLKNKNPKTALAHALSRKKTIRWGNKSDPFQTIELTHKVAPKIFNLLTKMNWSFVIQTKFTGVLMEYERYIHRANKKGLITVMPIMSPGLEKDWEIFERSRTTPPLERVKHLVHLQKKGVPVGFNGEPFIPGFHTEKDFENTMKLLKSYGISRYNTYNFHFNAFVAKRIHGLEGVDVERIWKYNQNAPWKKIQIKLIEIAYKYNIKLGCPDFVNTGPDYIEPANTCCGIDVPNPSTFNTHFFKREKQNGLTNEEIIEKTWDGTGDLETGKSIIDGTAKDMYNFKDAGLIK